MYIYLCSVPIRGSALPQDIEASLLENINRRLLDESLTNVINIISEEIVQEDVTSKRSITKRLFASKTLQGIEAIDNELKKKVGDKIDKLLNKSNVLSAEAKRFLNIFSKDTLFSHVKQQISMIQQVHSMGFTMYGAEGDKSKESTQEKTTKKSPKSSSTNSKSTKAGESISFITMHPQGFNLKRIGDLLKMAAKMNQDMCYSTGRLNGVHHDEIIRDLERNIKALWAGNRKMLDPFTKKDFINSNMYTALLYYIRKGLVTGNYNNGCNTINLLILGCGKYQYLASYSLYNFCLNPPLLLIKSTMICYKCY